jgi:hypothetical protein
LNLSICCTAVAEFGATRAPDGIGLLNGALGPKGRQQAGGALVAENDPNRPGHGLTGAAAADPVLGANSISISRAASE